ncbi:DUF2306 domain-containing protein [Stieleria sp. TO1_6]|uniref:DUF2306 domain-containing protein n=1 Tax=Stieleria tagensis TaxID=2956795 RepID=UPI00209B53BE|nr:DUF2306 domain-containing protein [Stieleria tagensis]MCO8121302.1 DUF2306 domain-containing protein [Stieleria tagensis]
MKQIAVCAAVILSLKVFLAILYQYRWYFPADFDASPFLSGRRYTFVGIYRAAFYAHLASGPTSLLLGTVLLLSGGRPGWSVIHRWLGKTQLILVLLIVVPSGLVMALQAYAGPIAEIGFMAQSLLLAVTVVAAAATARSRRFLDHQRWAQRCYILLWSPLLLRIVAGLMIVTDLESEWTYRINAWASWLVPLAIYELVHPPRHENSCAEPPFDVYPSPEN